MKKLAAMVVLVAVAAWADVELRNNGTVVGPVRELDAAVDGGLVATRASGSAVGKLKCASATTLTRGCVDLTTQTFAGDKNFTGNVTTPRIQAWVVDAGSGNFTGVVSAPMFDGGYAFLTNAVTATQAFVSDTTDDTAALVVGVGLDAGALVALSSGATAYAFQTGRYGSWSCTGCCAAHSCGPTVSSGARTLTINGTGDLTTAGSIVATSGVGLIQGNLVVGTAVTAGASGISSVGPMHSVSTLSVGAITLSGGTGTATVFSGAKCVCSEQTTAANGVKCSVSATTLTATGTNTDVITYLCL